ncbi:MAG: DUF4113 domain-containing protein [Candidatus Caenarcaniphilales bacterium]|nr:DUF4113 domain-containing protein [Candidatus Caenarcaniphilales bacterium]
MPSTSQLKLFALVDCNNFFVSCERAVNPALEGKPVVVLSNNDGCIVSRSAEAKALLIPMGAPFYKYKDLMMRHKVQVFSSNYRLYGDFSQRVMSILKQEVENIAVYSIDEAFLELSGSSLEELLTEARRLRKLIRQWTGIPVSVGLGATKTLAKLAGEVAKKEFSASGGVHALVSEADRDHAFRLPVGEIWGIGRLYASKLDGLGVYTVADLLRRPDSWIRRHLKIMGLRTTQELKGIPCFGLSEEPDLSKSIISSRSFGRPVTELHELEEAVATYTARAAEKLRQKRMLANYLHVYITTNRFRQSDPQYHNHRMVAFPTPTDYTPALISFAKKTLREIYREGFRYKKAGIMLTGLIENDQRQVNILMPPPDPREDKIMEVLDRLNGRFHRQAIRFLAMGTETPWKGKSEKRSIETLRPGLFVLSVKA